MIVSAVLTATPLEFDQAAYLAALDRAHARSYHSYFNQYVLTDDVRGQEIGITDYSGDWALVPQGGVDGCWVARQNLSESPPPENSAAVTAAPVLSRRSAIETLNDGPSCGTKWKCGQMDSCEEAYHYLNQCGLGRLDGDGDGVPCESIC